jgi:hypothetical protein
MIKCQECGSSQYDGALFCNECGGNLWSRRQRQTSILPFAAESVTAVPPSLSPEGAGETARPSSITFVIPSSGRRVVLKDVRQIDIGRMDERKDIEPGLDLTQDDGARHGVSRRHALIRFTARGAILMDLNSTNGTVLNRYRLMPERPYLVRTGDEIQFGRLLTHVFIE